ncbi:MAG: CoA transferase [Dehalococcoidia bacterium]
MLPTPGSAQRWQSRAACPADGAPQSALAALRVLEVSVSVAGAYAAKLLADLGAEVVNIEPEVGSPLRRLGPSAEGATNPDIAGLHQFLNSNKLGITEAPVGTARTEQGRQLLNWADLLITDLPQEEVAERLGEERDLEPPHPHLVRLSIRPFGASGPKSDWPSSDFVVYAQGGYHYLTGEPDKEPLALPHSQAEFHGGLQGAIGALVAIWARQTTGKGQRVEISQQEALISAHNWLMTMWFQQGQVQVRQGSPYIQCADGYLYLMELKPYHPNLWLLIDRIDLVDEERYSLPEVWNSEFNQILMMLEDWAADKTRNEVYRRAQELRIPLTPVRTLAEALGSEQLTARRWLQALGDSKSGRFRLPGFPYTLSQTPPQYRHRAPRIGEHNLLLANDPTRSPKRERREHNEPRPGGPLAGLRVVELTAHWAGPLCGRNLADFGAEVIKVELARKPASRHLVYPHDEMWNHHYNRSGYFNKLNRNKKAVCLDLSIAAGYQAFLKLVKLSDVLLVNLGVRVLDNLRIGFDELHKVNPRLVMCVISGMGLTGPEATYSAYGSNIETLSGLASLLRYDESSKPQRTGSYYPDPIAGGHATVAIMAALIFREQSNLGQLIDLSMVESTLQFLGEPVMAHLNHGSVGRNPPNKDLRFSPQGAYKCIGSDSWLAVTCQSDREWPALAEAIGRPDLAENATLNSIRGRLAYANEIDKAISDWSAAYDHNAAAAILRAVGVAAAPVAANWELAADSHLHRRGFFVAIDHPEVGTYLYPGFPWRLSDTPAAVHRPAPTFAEHNDEIFGRLLGLSSEEQTELYASGASSRVPDFGTRIP